MTKSTHTFGEIWCPGQDIEGNWPADWNLRVQLIAENGERDCNVYVADAKRKIMRVLDKAMMLGTFPETIKIKGRRVSLADCEQLLNQTAKGQR